MAEEFKIADAYVGIVGEVNKNALRTSATEAGTEGGRVLGDTVSREASRRMQKDNKGSFLPAGVGMGTEAGGGFLSGFAGMGAQFGAMMPKVLSNPYVLAGVAAVGATLAPVLMAGLAGGIMGAAGLGIIGLGAMLLKEEPALVTAATNLKTKVTGIFKTAAGPMLQPFVESLGKISGLFDRLQPSINKIFAAVAPAIGPLTDGFVKLAENAMPGLVTMFEAVGPMLIQMAPAFGELGKGISIFGREIAKAGPDAGVFLKDLVTWLGGVAASLGYMIGWFARGYGEVRNFFVSIPGWISSVGAWFTNLWNTITNFFSGIGQWFSSAGSSIASWATGAVAAIGNFVTSVLTWFTELPGRIGAFLTALPGIIMNAFVWAFDAATTFIGFAIGTVVMFFIQLPGRISNAVSSLWSAMVSHWNTMKTNVTNFVTTTIENAVTFFRNLPGRVSSAVSSLWSSMVGHWNSAKTGAINAAQSLVDSAVNWFRQLPGRATSALSGVKSSVLGAFSGAGSWLVSAGRDLLEGIARGISSATGFVVDAAKRAANNIISGFKNALGISSPSKVAARQVGRWILPGVTEGIRATLPRARRDVQTAAGSLLPTPSALSASAAATAGPTYHFAPGAIVLDASRLSSIQDVIDLIGGIRATARATHARTATAPGV